MSRCFPFPPPGYERKLRVDDDNLLVKEKDREKKHKRDKNKEKKDGKERDKNKSKDKHRDKEKDKEKKEKHKHKDKDKKKDKSQSRDEKAGSSNAERVGSNSPRNHFTGSSSTQHLNQRISYLGIATRIENNVKINDRDHGRGELLEKPRFDQMVNGQRVNGEARLPNVAIACRSNGVDDKRAEMCRPMEIDKPVEEKQNQVCNRIEKGVQNKDKNGKRFEGQGVQINRPNDTVFVQELGRRISAENGQVVARPNSTNHKRIDSNGTFVNCDKEISNFGNGINRKDSVPKVQGTHNFNGLEGKGHAMVRPVGMDKSASVEGMGRNGFTNGVGLTGHNEKKAINNDEVRNKAKTGGGNIVNISRLGGRNGSDSTELDYTSEHALPVSKSMHGVAAKRKEPQANNGFLHDNGVPPFKLQRRVVPSQSTNDGRNLQHSGTITLCASNQNKESKVVNDVVSSQQSFPFSAIPSTVKPNWPIVSPESPLVSSKSPSSVVDAILGSTKSKSKSKSKDKDKERDRSLKSPSPHPDAKYLSQIYSVPMIDDWSESNDDEWLFDSKSSRSKETNMGSLTNDDGQLQVWDKAINIDSLDVYALPYVISC